MFKEEIIYKLNTIVDNVKNYDGFWSETNIDDIDELGYLKEITDFLGGLSEK